MVNDTEMAWASVSTVACDCLNSVLGQSPSQKLCTVRPVSHSSLHGGKAMEWVGGEGKGRLKGGWPGKEEEAQLAGCCYGNCAEEILLRGLRACGGLGLRGWSSTKFWVSLHQHRDERSGGKDWGWRSQAQRGLLSNENSCHWLLNPTKHHAECFKSISHFIGR